jgi:hypothetical protein
MEPSTIQQLTDRLITDSGRPYNGFVLLSGVSCFITGNIRRDEEYRDIYLATHTAFTSGMELIGMLQRMFSDAPLDRSLSPEDRSRLLRKYAARRYK